MWKINAGSTGLIWTLPIGVSGICPQNPQCLHLFLVLSPVCLCGISMLAGKVLYIPLKQEEPGTQATAQLCEG